MAFPVLCHNISIFQPSSIFPCLYMNSEGIAAKLNSSVRFPLKSVDCSNCRCRVLNRCVRRGTYWELLGHATNAT